MKEKRKYENDDVYVEKRISLLKFSLRERLALSSSPSCFSTRDVDEKNDTRCFRERNTSFFLHFFFIFFF